MSCNPTVESGNFSPCVKALYVPSDFIFIIGFAFSDDSKNVLSFLSYSIPSGF
jgi:hypothetical protein